MNLEKHSQTKICECCHQTFICNENKIINCHCSKITLSANAIEFINKKYKNCLCFNCLKAINEIKY